MTTKACVNQQGGMYLEQLIQEAIELFLWAEQNLVSLKAEHLVGEFNTIVKLADDKRIRMIAASGCISRNHPLIWHLENGSLCIDNQCFT